MKDGYYYAERKVTCELHICEVANDSVVINDRQGTICRTSYTTEQAQKLYDFYLLPSLEELKKPKPRDL